MNSINYFICGLFVTAVLTTPVLADWQTSTGENGASASVVVDGDTLTITCNPNDPKFFLTLSGGPFPGMKNIDDVNDSLMMWIEAADGRTARHPIDGHYFAPDATFVGRFLTSDVVLDQFAGGKVMRLTAVTGETILETTMTGTGKARANFQRACKL